MASKKKDDVVIQPDNMIVLPLTTVQYKDRMKAKLARLAKEKK